MHWQKITAQPLSSGSGDSVLSSKFVKPEIFQKARDLSFNIVRIYNHSETAVRIRPYLDIPPGWAVFSTSFVDTVIQPHDSISLPLRLRIPDQASCDEKHKIFFRVYSESNDLLTESTFYVNAEPNHNWDIIMPETRMFFYPRMNNTPLSIRIVNNGNTKENISLSLSPDRRLTLSSLGTWNFGDELEVPCGTDTVLEFNVSYNEVSDRVFDLTKVKINASASDKTIFKSVLIEKYSDIYSPFYVDPYLPHEVEVGLRTYRGNKRFLPFIKTRGFTEFNDKSSFRYNFTFYELDNDENFIQNSYYSFLYQRNNLRAGIGAFGSQLGRNLYTRSCVMLNDRFALNKNFELEGYASQSFLTPKTSLAIGSYYKYKLLQFTGSAAYDIDKTREVNTGSLLFRSNSIRIFKSHQISGNFYMYHEKNYFNKEYSLAGIAWDLNYSVKIGSRASIFLSNTYGSPNVPGPQMGLVNFVNLNKLFLSNQKLYFTILYNYSSRNYYNFNFEGIRQPPSDLEDNYASIKFHNHINSKFTWEIGPSVEFYNSRRPSTKIAGIFNEYSTQKFRIELKSVMANRLLISLKAGLSHNYFKELYEFTNDKYDLHIMGSVYISNGVSAAFNYDYGPMVNSGLYQYPSDAMNNSFAVMPQITKTYFDDRLTLSLFATLSYKLDLKYGMLGISPLVEAYISRDWYAGLDGTYSYSQQNLPELVTSNSHYYLEFFIKKKWGKRDFDKWQKNTKRLKIVMFKDDNANGVKDDFEEGVPFVKAHLKLSDAMDPNAESSFPVDITLLSNSTGAVIFNRLPMGLYDLSVSPITDLKEYFYTDKAVDKIELTKSQTYYIPFQRANKISGQIVVQRTTYIKPGDEKLELGNIKITAYNNQGNSYSSFTTGNGSFVIFVPGDYVYFVRMQNVFGSSFRILQNDIRIPVGKSTLNQVVFEVSEISRQVNFKQAAPLAQDTTQPTPLKIKVLHGQFYENSSLAAVDKNALPVFEVKDIPAEEQMMIPGNYYIVIGDAYDKPQALTYKKIIEENGFNAYLGHDNVANKYYVYTNYYSTQTEAKKELKLLNSKGMKEGRIMKFE